MSSYTVPLSSSPQAPSTPGLRQTRASKLNLSNMIGSHPSTTPAGPPLSAAGSFTPPDPPSSVFGSSSLGSGKTLFKSKGALGATGSSKKSQLSSTSSSTSINKSKLARYLNHSSRFDVSNGSKGDSRNQPFDLPSRSPSPEVSTEEEPEQDADGDEELVEYYEDEDSDDEVGRDSRQRGLDVESSARVYPLGIALDPTTGSIRQLRSSAGQSANYGSSLLSTPRGVKRSRGGAAITYDSPRSVKKPSKPRKDSAMRSIAKNLATQLGAAKLSEPDNLILQTEDLISVLYAAEQDDAQAVRAALPRVSDELCKVWDSCHDRDIANRAQGGDVVVGIGPDNLAPPSHKAIFLSTLLLQLHHPRPAKGKQALAVSVFGRPHASAAPPTSPEALVNPTALPKVLLDWLDKNHNPYSSTFSEVETTKPSPPAHYNFWDIIFVLLLRGKIRDVIRILRMSNFQHAGTAKNDGQEDGYIATQITSIDRVIIRATQALERCPALQNDDRHVTGGDWIIYRKQIEQYLDDLSNFAEGRDRHSEPAPSAFEASNFGLQSTTTTLSQSTRRAESRVPWTIYQNLKAMYGIILGQATEIVASAQDWVEATIGLTVWWDGDDSEDVTVGSLALTRRSLKHPQSRSNRLVDIDMKEAYLRRLAFSFYRATDDSDDELFLINSNNPVEVGLASVFEGNVEGVVGLLRGWSLPVASAVAEVATLGGWFGSSLSSAVMRNFDESDLMVLSGFGQPEHPIRRDTIMIEYADALFERERLTGSQQQETEGWELSIALLARLGDDGISKKRIREVLERLPLQSDQRMDVILRICHDYGMGAEARSMTERYADSILDRSENYGTALIYYARAHSKKKVKDVLDLLGSLCLVQSVAVPILSDLDANLHSLIFTPKESLEQIASIDAEAAEMLHLYLTGYATLRRFYDLRDEEANLKDGQTPTIRPIARRTLAATALIAVINSAADNIHGGLFDETRGAVVQVDGLLALLGEAIIFVNQPTTYPLTMPQSLTLLKAIEDLQTVPPRIYAQCEECFRSTLSAYHSQTTPPSPRQLLKTMSSMTSGSSFSLVGSSMLDSQTSSGTGSSALVKSVEEVKRGWDWRQGLKRDASGEEVLRILRLGLARGLAGLWMEA